MDEVDVIFRIKKCSWNVWEAMKDDVYMHFTLKQLIPLFNKLE